jgi:hypothetical protein
VETNIKSPNGNSIAGFVSGTNGQLQPIPGSPFLTGGAGTQDAGISLGPEDSDQDIITNRDHTLRSSGRTWTIEVRALPFHRQAPSFAEVECVLIVIAVLIRDSITGQFFVVVRGLTPSGIAPEAH